LKFIRTLICATSLLFLAGCAGVQGAVIENTSSEQKCLAEAIYYEAQSEPESGKIAVAHVVLNRTHNKNYPSTICKVVYQRGYHNKGCQFSWSCRHHTAPKGQHWQQSQRIAELVLANQTEDLSKGALSFNNKHQGFKRLRKTVVIGNQAFYQPSHSFSN
jgi:spore germination cell wall hydrolase CwlJ-like protein